jgi:hypothetical protein
MPHDTAQDGEPRQYDARPHIGTALRGEAWGAINVGG